jgi:hypothetical protein
MEPFTISTYVIQSAPGNEPSTIKIKNKYSKNPRCVLILTSIPVRHRFPVQGTLFFSQLSGFKFVFRKRTPVGFCSCTSPGAS